MYLLGKVPPGYRDWDAERREDEGGTQGSLVPGKDDKRFTFEIDKARIVHSASLRRLQGKTQVLGVGERDFYRTRLTHSLEVAQIGRGLCREITQPPEFQQVDADLVEAICLAHDIGHPAFGHIGEDCLHRKMFTHGGFGANPQNLRIVTFIESKRPDGGLNLSRAALDGLTKYPVVFDLSKHEKTSKFVYQEEKDLLAWIKGGRTRLPLEGQIADWADAIAYSVHDIEDSFRAGLLDFNEMRKRADEISGAAKKSLEKAKIDDVPAITNSGAVVAKAEEFYKDLVLEPIKYRDRKIRLKRWTSQTVFRLMDECSIEADPAHAQDDSSRYRYRLQVPAKVQATAAILKCTAQVLVFDDPRVKTLEHKGIHILEALFDTFVANTKLLPLDFQELLRDGKATKERLVADFVAGMTDNYATEYYERLFQPRAGSFYKDV